MTGMTKKPRQAMVATLRALRKEGVVGGDGFIGSWLTVCPPGGFHDNAVKIGSPVRKRPIIGK